MAFESLIISAIAKHIFDSPDLIKKGVDIPIVKDVAKTMGGNITNANAKKVIEEVNKMNNESALTDGGKIGDIHNIMVGSPGEYGLDLVANAGINSLAAAGDTYRNKAAHMARAILEAGRSGTDRQVDRYGYTLAEKAARMAAERRAYENERTGRMFDVAADSLGKTYDRYRTDVDRSKMMEAGTKTGLSGGFYDYMNGAERRAYDASQRVRGEK